MIPEPTGAGRAILAELKAMEARIMAELRKLTPSAPVAAAVASDTDLDGQYGDPEVRKDPKRWEGAALAPCKMSQCPPDYLDEVASFKDWQAGKEEEKNTDEGRKKAGYCRKDASRARGWAARKRAVGDEL